MPTPQEKINKHTEGLEAFNDTRAAEYLHGLFESTKYLTEEKSHILPSDEVHNNEYIKIGTISTDIENMLSPVNLECSTCHSKSEAGIMLKEYCDNEKKKKGPIQYNLFQFQREDETKYYIDRLLSDLESLLKHKCDFICMNELAFPFSDFSDPSRKFVENFEKKIFELLQEYPDCVIIAGSFHEPKRAYNLSPIYCSKNEKPILHAKMLTAPRTGEKIRVPFNKEIWTYEYKGLKFTNLICLDIYDPVVLLTMTKTNMEVNPELKHYDIVFNPSYSHHSGAYKSCEAVSYLCSNIVVHVNQYKTNHISDVYVCGTRLTGFNMHNPSEQTIGEEIEKKDHFCYTIDGQLGRNKYITVYSINKSQIQSGKDSRNQKILENKELVYLMTGKRDNRSGGLTIFR